MSTSAHKSTETLALQWRYDNLALAATALLQAPENTRRRDTAVKLVEAALASKASEGPSVFTLLDEAAATEGRLRAEVAKLRELMREAIVIAECNSERDENLDAIYDWADNARTVLGGFEV